MMTNSYAELEAAVAGWQPAPGSALATAWEAYGRALADYQAAAYQLDALRAERAVVRARIEGVTAETAVEEVAGDIGRAGALDLIVMRAEVSVSRLRAAERLAHSEADGHIESLLLADKQYRETVRRYGEGSDSARHADNERRKEHMRLLATPESSPVS